MRRERERVLAYRSPSWQCGCWLRSAGLSRNAMRHDAILCALIASCTERRHRYAQRRESTYLPTGREVVDPLATAMTNHHLTFFHLASYLVCARVTITLSAAEPRVYVRTCRTWHIERTARYHYHCHRTLTDCTHHRPAAVEASGRCRRSGASDTQQCRAGHTCSLHRA